MKNKTYEGNVEITAKYLLAAIQEEQAGEVEAIYLDNGEYEVVLNALLQEAGDVGHPCLGKTVALWAQEVKP